MTENIPPTLSTITPLPEPRPGEILDRRNRRPRNLIPGERANTLPEIRPGAKIFRVNPDPDHDPRLSAEFLDSRDGRAAMREWGRANEFDVKPAGKVPAKLRAAYVQARVDALAAHRAAGYAAMREWGLRNGYTVHARDPIPPEVRAGFMKENDIWTVEVVSSRLPKAGTFSQHFHVRQGGYTKVRTIYPHVIRRAMGRELWELLWEVT